MKEIIIYIIYIRKYVENDIYIRVANFFVILLFFRFSGGADMENQFHQEIKNKKQSLKRYRVNRVCVNRLEEKLTLLDEKIKSIKSPNYSGMPRGSTPITIDELLSDKIDLERRIRRLKDKGKKIKDLIVEEIDSLEDPLQAEVLEMFFIDCKSIEDIAEDMGYTDRHIYNIYKNAIDELVFSNVS